MKHIFIFLLFAIVACKKTPTPAPPATSLTITVTDDGAIKQSGATVDLYSTQNSFDLGTNAVATATTTTDGTAVFASLAGGQYWYRITSGCKNNISGISPTTVTVAANVSNTTTVALRRSCTLQFTNNSADPYRIFINGVQYIDLPGGHTGYAYNQLAGAISVRVLQLSGFVSTPTDQTYNGVVNCGETATVSFP
jgi:hypothetical protein